MAALFQEEVMRLRSFVQLIGKILLPILFLSWALGNFLGTTYARNSGQEPDVVITVNQDGSTSQEGNLFGDAIWIPGSEQSGIIRIQNQFQKFEVTNLGVAVELLRFKEGYGRDIVYDSFLRNMKLIIEKGKLLDFWSPQRIVDNKSLAELAYEAGNQGRQGYTLKESDRFSIDKNDFVDLKYTLSMDYENSGNELQGIKANLSLLINAHEKAEDSAPADPENPVNPSDPEEDPEDTEPADPSDPTEPSKSSKRKGSSTVDKTAIPEDASGHWAHDCIKTLLEHGVISGYSDGTIRPDEPITRAETTVLIRNALQLISGQGALHYRDALPSWARDAIQATSARKIFVGYPDGTFRANQNITREEMTVVLIKAFNIKLDGDISLPFRDRAQIGKWAEEYVEAAVQHEIVVGYPDNTFRPKQAITRAEAFTIICKLMGWHPEHSFN